MGFLLLIRARKISGEHFGEIFARKVMARAARNIYVSIVLALGRWGWAAHKLEDAGGITENTTAELEKLAPAICHGRPDEIATRHAFFSQLLANRKRDLCVGTPEPCGRVDHVHALSTDSALALAPTRTA